MNDHIHPVFREVLNAFADTRPLRRAQVLDAERRADIQEDLRAEWRQEDSEREQLERQECGR
jgi:hypothetical protein